ncbi:MAG: 30S ribosomal protein S24e [Sulfolobales archaeon]
MEKPLKVIKIDDKRVLFILNERFNNLLKRREIEARIEHVGMGTPTRSEVREILSKVYSVDKDLVVIRRIDTSYGRGSSRIIARIYSDVDTLKKFEHEYILARDSGEKKKKSE